MNDRIATVAIFALACATYAFLLTDGQPLHGYYALIKYPGDGLNLVFNSMADRLLQGRFDVDPNIVGWEGFLVGGKTIAYWGIPFAVIRMPLALFSGGLRLDVTGLSSLMAVGFAALAKLKSLRLLFKKKLIAPRGVIYWLMVFTLLFSGAQIEFLKISVYQEVCLWAGALTAYFVFLALDGLLSDDFSSKLLCGMAVIAGTALLSRVSTGIGLYTACGFLLLSLVVFPRNSQTTRISRLITPAIVAPLSIMFVFGCAAALVNYERWGSPWVFADYHFYIVNITHPDRFERLAAYGMFNLCRIPSSLSYYLFPVWMLSNGSGSLVLETLQTRLYDFTELPPSTFMLTDMLLVGFAVYTTRCLFPLRRGVPNRRIRAVVIAAGLCTAGALMLTAISLAYRYRIEFYPLLEFVAFIGIYLFLRRSSRYPDQSLFPKCLIGVGAVLSIAMSNCALLLYKLSPFGTGIDLMHVGFLTYYTARWDEHLIKFFH